LGGGRKDICPIRNHVPLILGGSLPEQVVEEDPRDIQLIQIHVEKWTLHGSISRLRQESTQSPFLPDFA